MNELIKVTYDNDRPAVSARDLHDFLEVKTAYKDWFPRMCEYGFTEGEDFCSFLSESTGGRPAQDAILTIDMAKELCMIQRNEKGKLARQYFIQIEKGWNSPEKIMARALKIAKDKIMRLETKVEEDKPKVLFADAVSASHTSILVGELAKLLRQNGEDIGQNRLFAQHTNIFDRKRHRKIPHKIDDSLLTIRRAAIIIRSTEGEKAKSPLNVRRLVIVSNVGGSSILDYSLTVVKPKHEGRRIFLFYENVKRLCEKKGTNFCAVEKACGIGNGVLGKFSDGDRDPSVKTLKKLSKYFNVPMDKLLK